MSSFYFDSSALVKKYALESGSDHIIEFFNSNPLVVTSEITKIEIASAISRKTRELSLSKKEKELILGAFFNDCKDIIFLPVKESMINLAIKLLNSHPLKAYESLHLASALIYQQLIVPVEEESLLLFVSSDKNLLSTTTKEGLQVKNPVEDDIML
jgi:hypothetical protein